MAAIETTLRAHRPLLGGDEPVTPDPVAIDGMTIVGCFGWPSVVHIVGSHFEVTGAQIDYAIRSAWIQDCNMQMAGTSCMTIKNAQPAFINLTMIDVTLATGSWARKTANTIVSGSGAGPLFIASFLNATAQSVIHVAESTAQVVLDGTNVQVMYGTGILATDQGIIRFSDADMVVGARTDGFEVQTAAHLAVNNAGIYVFENALGIQTSGDSTFDVATISFILESFGATFLSALDASQGSIRHSLLERRVYNETPSSIGPWDIWDSPFRVGSSRPVSLSDCYLTGVFPGTVVDMRSQQNEHTTFDLSHSDLVNVSFYYPPDMPRESVRGMIAVPNGGSTHLKGVAFEGLNATIVNVTAGGYAFVEDCLAIGENTENAMPLFSVEVGGTLDFINTTVCHQDQRYVLQCQPPKDGKEAVVRADFLYDIQIVDECMWTIMPFRLKPRGENESYSACVDMMRVFLILIEEQTAAVTIELSVDEKCARQADVQLWLLSDGRPVEEGLHITSSTGFISAELEYGTSGGSTFMRGSDIRMNISFDADAAVADGRRLANSSGDHATCDVNLNVTSVPAVARPDMSKLVSVTPTFVGVVLSSSDLTIRVRIVDTFDEALDSSQLPNSTSLVVEQKGHAAERLSMGEMVGDDVAFHFRPKHAGDVSVTLDLGAFGTHDLDPFRVTSVAWLYAAIAAISVIVIVAVVIIARVVWRNVKRNVEAKAVNQYLLEEYADYDIDAIPVVDIKLGELPDSITSLPQFEYADIADKLQPENMIGVGSAGQVFLIRWNGEPRAIKRIPVSAASDDMQRLRDGFVEEVSLMYHLDHPNVLSIYAACFQPPFFCIMCEFCPRGSLFELIHNKQAPTAIAERYRSMPLPDSSAISSSSGGDEAHMIELHEWLAVLHELITGIAYLHTRNPPIVHRDLKPHNILLGDNYSIHIADFGLAKSLVNTCLSGGATQGSPAWMAPEALLGASATEKCDLYAFGVIMWEIGTGDVPWSGRKFADIVRQVGLLHEMLDVRDFDERMVRHMGSVPRDVLSSYRTLMIECLSHDPARRPSADQCVQRIGALRLLPSVFRQFRSGNGR